MLETQFESHGIGPLSLTAKEVNASTNIPLAELLDLLKRQLPDVFNEVSIEDFIDFIEKNVGDHVIIGRIHNLIEGIDRSLIKKLDEGLATARINNEKTGKGVELLELIAS